jgi:RNA polymerase sigma-70 factor (ECF subfamily)
MHPTHLERVIHCLRQAVEPTAGEPSDGELLHRFIAAREEAAFAALVRRHGAMVLGVCRRLLPEHDADDAFQATFLVLVRRAGSVRKVESLASWLYGVALRVARQTRSTTATRRRCEAASVLHPIVPDPAAEPEWRELRSVIDEELAQLPEKYRAPIVLCYLEGKTNEEAARLLGWTKGTVSGRLARARDLLRGRLARRGLALTTGALAGLLLENAAAPAPAALVETTLRGALGGGASTAAAALAEGVMRTMLAKQLSVILGALLGVTVLFAGASLSGPRAGVSQAVAVVVEAAEERPGTLFGGASPVALKDEAESLEGVWSASHLEENGKKAPVEAVRRFRVVIKGDEMVFNPDTENRRSTFKLDPRKKPKAIILTPQDGPDKGRAVEGIYALEKDRLTICIDRAAGKAKPTEFATGPGSGLALLILVRDPEPKERVVGKDEPRRPRPDGALLWQFDAGRPTRAAAVAPDGQTVAVASAGRIELLEMRTGKAHTRFELTDGQVYALAYSPDGRRLAVGGSEGKDKPVGVVKLFDRSGNLIRSQSAHGMRTTALAFSPDGKWLASSGLDGSAMIQDVETGKELRRFSLSFERPLDGSSTALAFSPDGKTLAAGGADQSVRVYEVTAGRVIYSLHSDKEVVNSVAFSPDGKTVASLDANGKVLLWDARVGKLVSAPSVGRSSVTSVAFSPDGQRIAVAAQGVIQVRRMADSADGDQFRPEGAPSRVVGLQFTPDGKALVSWDQAGAVRLWLLPRGAGSGGRHGRDDREQPAEQVEGEVKKVQDRLVQLSVGSDAGLREGNLLEVFRLKPAPLYLGQVKVLRVTPHDAVAQEMGRSRGTIQVGDRVASRIVRSPR